MSRLAAGLSVKITATSSDCGLLNLPLCILGGKDSVINSRIGFVLFFSFLLKSRTYGLFAWRTCWSGRRTSSFVPGKWAFRALACSVMSLTKYNWTNWWSWSGCGSSEPSLWYTWPCTVNVGENPSWRTTSAPKLVMENALLYARVFALKCFASGSDLVRRSLISSGGSCKGSSFVLPFMQHNDALSVLNFFALQISQMWVIPPMAVNFE